MQDRLNDLEHRMNKTSKNFHVLPQRILFNLIRENFVHAEPMRLPQLHRLLRRYPVKILHRIIFIDYPLLICNYVPVMYVNFSSPNDILSLFSIDDHHRQDRLQSSIR